MAQDEENQDLESQSAGAVAGFVLMEGIKAILGFIIVSLFKPVWDKMIGWWKKDKEE